MTTQTKKQKAVTAFSIVTDRVIQALTEAIEQGHAVAPWDTPWYTDDTTPRSARTGEPYRGANRFFLGLLGLGMSPYWATANQLNQMGAKINPEEFHSNGGRGYAPLLFWDWRTEDQLQKLKDKGIENPTKCIVRWYRVWNLSQTDLPQDQYPDPAGAIRQRREFTPIEEAEAIVQGYKGCPTITFSGGIAAYHPQTDTIIMPDKDRFLTDEELYSTLFHELIHSTGHKLRMNREEIVDPKRFGTPSYAREELVAELGGCLLAGAAGFEKATEDRSFAYLQNWITKLKNDVSLLPRAAQSAQKAAEFVLGA